MGHAVHFLQRVERLSPVQADLALTLYREPGLVRHVLRVVSLPEGAERVALALEDAPEGPHVIVTRDGQFVTCLGAGMTVGECPVVSRLQLDRASDRIERLRAAVDRSTEIAQLYERVLDGGSALSREDFLALAALVPLLGREYMNAALQMAKFLTGTLQRYRRPRYRKLTPLLREELRLYWTAEWALGHLAALCGERPDDVRAMCTLEGSDYEIFMRGLAELASHCASPPILLRGAWAAARAGRTLLPKLRQKMQAAENRIEAMRIGVPLVTLAMRHSRAFAETSKGLASQRRKLQDADPLRSSRGQIAIVIRELQKVLDPESQDKLRRDHILLGAHAYAAFAERFPADSPMRFTRVEDVPEDLALTAAVNFDGNLYRDHQDIARTLTAIPWLATASGADLYFPAKFFESCGPLFPLEATRERIDSYYRFYLFDRPARAEERPGRNEPCSCGSGKKYKRCCGASA
jgi:hypothetical protein